MWRSPWTRWAVLLGTALGGFFDGILLHQILQWHHLLSLVPGMADIRTQVLWDGYFHALMYVLAAIALWGLWRAHRSGEAGSSRGLGGGLLIGFGLWHVLDSVLSHWLLGIHRIKLDSPNPLAWDLIWFTAFGLVPLAAGVVALRAQAVRPTHSALSVALLFAVTAAAGSWAMQPPPEQPFTTVVFRKHAEPQQVFGALADADARLVWSDAAGEVLVVHMAPDRRWRLWRAGALLVGGAGVPPGCFIWSRSGRLAQS